MCSVVPFSPKLRWQAQPLFTNDFRKFEYLYTTGLIVAVRLAAKRQASSATPANAIATTAIAVRGQLLHFAAFGCFRETAKIFHASLP
jgi:hypothetical protein